MVATVREAIRELLHSTEQTLDALLSLLDEDRSELNGHLPPGRGLFMVLTNEPGPDGTDTVGPEKPHDQAETHREAMARLVREWFRERSDLIGALIGLTEEEFNHQATPGDWTYRQVTTQLVQFERDSLESIRDGVSRKAS